MFAWLISTGAPVLPASCISLAPGCPQGFNAALSIGYLAWRETAASRSDHERLRPTMAVFSAGPLKSYAALAVPAIIAYCQWLGGGAGPCCTMA